MGLPITKYTLLKAVAKDEDIFYSSYHTNKLNKFRSFKLYGIILHDPTTHCDFHLELGKQFDFLDHLTGQHFLFMGLTDTPQEWVRGREYHREYMDVFDQKNTGADYRSDDAGITAFTIAKALNIEYDDLPVILLTDDLRKKDFDIVRTFTHTLKDQLTKIGFYCSRLDRPPLMHKSIESNAQFSRDQVYLDMLKEIDVCKDRFQNQIAFGLANVFSDILSIFAQGKYFLQDKFAKEDQRLFVERVRSQITTAKDKPDDLKNIEIIENQLLLLMGMLASLKENRNNDYGLSIDEGCENESHTIIRTFNKVAPTYGCFTLLDYSPLIICLGKVFEKEVNLSIVHWIRKHLGIEMPRYFNIRKITDESYTFTPLDTIVPTPQPVDFNQGLGYAKWRPPSIGASESVFKSLLERKKIPDELTQPCDFAQKWEQLRLARNRAAHAEIINHDAYIAAYDAFSFINDEKMFWQMNSIKAKLKH